MHFKSFKSLALHLQNRAIKRYKANLNSALHDLGKDIQETAQARIGTHASAVGQYPSWKPLAPSTVAKKTRMGWGKNGNPGSPLYATGAFSRDISHKVNKSRSYVVVGTNKEYIAYHEFGSSKHPPRPVFGPSAHLVIPKHLNKIKKAGVDGLSGASTVRFKR